MQTIQLEVEDTNVETVLNIIQNLKENLITKYQLVNDQNEDEIFTELSQKSLEKVWDNQEDSVYDKFLQA